MGSVIPLKKSVNSAYLDLKNLVSKKLSNVESLIDSKLQSKVDLINKMSKHHFSSGGKSSISFNILCLFSSKKNS